MNHLNRRRPIVATLAAVSLALNAVMPLIAASQPPAPKPAAAAQTPPAQPAATVQTAAATPAAAPVIVDGGWPRSYTLPGGGTILVFQPQTSSWDQQAKLVAFSAVTYHVNKTEKPAIGTIRLEADTKVALTERLVSFQQMRIAEANFQTLPREKVREISAEIEKAIPHDERVISLDRVLANMDKSVIVPKNVEGVKADPPAIFFSKTPAVIVNIDGEVIWSPIKENDLKFAVNTNWDLFQHGTNNLLYLRHGESWLSSSTISGPWKPAGALPDSFKKLPADDNWKDVLAAVPGKPIGAAAVPRVFVTQTPSELILLTGEPKYVPVTGTGLSWVSNTDSDVFRMGPTGAVYYLVTGRWFTAADFSGPWTFATPTLPADFKKIPVEHERSRVLASVPGTDQAAEAVLIASVPQVAKINKKEVKAPEVLFQGDPQFSPIETTSIERAVNTDKDVFKIRDTYYMCYQAVWFIGKSATGPWEVATTVPPEIYKIPASSPASHVTYVTVGDDDDANDDWVTYAAYAGYTGMMVAWGCTVWGSGWYYPPYYGWYGGYPYYYGYFPTYGYSAFYNPWTGAYGRSMWAYGPYGGAGVGARYNPRTGTYARGAAVYGPYGARGVASAYNPRTGTYAATRQGSNPYSSWGSTGVVRGDDWAKTNRYTNRVTDTTTRTIRTDDGSAVMRRGESGGVGVTDGGNIYAGKDGNVYRRQDGTWQKYDGGNWTNTDRQPERPNQGLPAGTDWGTGSTERPTTMDRSTQDQLNRDSAARREGTTRTRDYGTYRGGSGSSGMGSYRGGGGGGRSRGGGGGGRRR